MTICEAVKCVEPTDSSEKYCTYHLECIKKLHKFNVGNIEDKTNRVIEIGDFETWFNENCGYVIVREGSDENYTYHSWLVLYYPENGEKNEFLLSVKCESCSDLDNAKDSVRKIMKELKEEEEYSSLIEKIHPGNEGDFNKIIAEPYVTRTNISCPSNFFQEAELKRFAKENFQAYDIIWVKRRRYIFFPYYHVGIYLGPENVFHLHSKKGALVNTWEDFLENRCEGIIRIRQNLPFRHYKKIIEEIRFAYANEVWKEKYSLDNNNCEHLTNMLVFRINYSEQVGRKKEFFNRLLFSRLRYLSQLPYFSRIANANNGKSSLINLNREMTESTELLGKLTNKSNNELSEKNIQSLRFDAVETFKIISLLKKLTLVINKILPKKLKKEEVIQKAVIQEPNTPLPIPKADCRIM